MAVEEGNRLTLTSLETVPQLIEYIDIDIENNGTLVLPIQSQTRPKLYNFYSPKCQLSLPTK